MKEQTVYIVDATRSAITKANKGGFANTRPDELLSKIIQASVKKSGVNPSDIEDVIMGCAFPEAEQGQNIARVASLLAGLPDTVPGITINRYCSSGLNSIAMAADMIQAGRAHVVLAGGIESMSLIPMGGNDWSVSPTIFNNDKAHVDIAYGMGITAENVANRWGITRLEQDEFALNSHKMAAAAINNNYFNQEIEPIEIVKYIPNEKTDAIDEHKYVVSQDEGVRFDTSLESLAKLKPAFAQDGSVTAGNSSQMSDGAACLVLVSEEYLNKHKLTPLAKFRSFAVAGVPPKIMGIGPIVAIPKALKQAKLTLDDIDWIELNEAFAAQSLAVIKELKLDSNKINPYGGAIAVGHPLGATGAILACKIIYGLKRTQKRYGLVTMCIGIGMGAAGIFEVL